MEVYILGSLDSKYVPKLFDVYFNSNKLYLQLEKAGIMTLKEFISHPQYKKKVELFKILYIKIVKAVSFIHSKNIIHGDIKTANIMVTSNFSVKLIDFGYSIEVTSKNDLIDNYSGTPVYLAPEIIKKTPYNGKLLNF